MKRKMLCAISAVMLTSLLSISVFAEEIVESVEIIPEMDEVQTDEIVAETESVDGIIVDELDMIAPVGMDDELVGATIFGGADKLSATAFSFNVDYTIPLEIDDLLVSIPQWFKFTTDEIGYYKVIPNGNADVEIFNANGNKLYSKTNGSLSSSDSYIDRLEKNTTYYICAKAHCISSYGIKPGIYNLAFNITKYPDPEGNIISEAKSIGVGEYKSSIAESGDVDYLKFTPSKSGYYKIEMSEIGIKNYLGWAYIDAVLKDSEGKPINTIWGRTNGSVTGEVIKNVFYKLNSGQDYYITISAYVYSGGYTLNIFETNTVNPTKETALSTTEIGKTYSVKTEAGDRLTDFWYKLKTGNNDAWYLYKIERGNNNYSDQIYDESNELIVSHAYYESYPRYYSTKEKNKTIYLHLAPDYCVDAKWTCYEYADPEGDTPETGYTLTEGVAYLGNLCLWEDSDWYKISPITSGTYTISMKSNDAGYVKYDFKDGDTSVKSGQFSDRDSNSTSITVNLLSGKTYYLMIDSDNTGGYTLTYKLESKPVTAVFTDLGTNAWYINAVQYAYDNKIMSGTTETTFAPNTPCTRGMMVTILYTSIGKPSVSGTTPFVDLRSNWYKDAVLWAYKNGITKGQTDTTFAPDKNVSRQEMAVFLMTYAKLRRYDMSASADISKFVDVNQLASWATPQMKWANANGIINGKGGNRLDPKGNATRAEVAAMIMSFQNKFGK